MLSGRRLHRAVGRSHVRSVKSESANNLPSVPSAAATTNIAADYVLTVARRRLPIVRRLPVRKLQLLPGFWNRWYAIDWPIAWRRRTSASSGRMSRGVSDRSWSTAGILFTDFSHRDGTSRISDENLVWLDNDLNIFQGREEWGWST